MKNSASSHSFLGILELQLQCNSLRRLPVKNLYLLSRSWKEFRFQIVRLTFSSIPWHVVIPRRRVISWYVSHVPAIDRGWRDSEWTRVQRNYYSFLRERRRGRGFGDRDTGCLACRRVDREINGALITLIEALRRIDTAPIGPVSFRDTDRSYDK